MLTERPEWITPMAATLTQARFIGPEWTFERKFDGIRLLAFKEGSEVRLFSRNRLSKTVPAIAGAIEKLDARDLILDGELTWGAQGVACLRVMFRRPRRHGSAGSPSVARCWTHRRSTPSRRGLTAPSPGAGAREDGGRIRSVSFSLRAEALEVSAR